jgi:myo-inositol 2-dehydrogenase/D-chiro-inositol 1-dehydrogenase
MTISDNRKPHEVKKFNIDYVDKKAPLLNFFIERYQEAYMLEITSFAEMVINKTNPVVGFEDGHKALILAETAYRSVISGKMESIYN